MRNPSSAGEPALTIPYSEPPQARAYLVVHVEAPELGPTARVLDLPDGTDLTVGRSRGATLQVDHERVSRAHARIRRVGDRVDVEDLGSRNGTQVNGTTITGVTRLAAGDVLTIGPATLLLGLTSALRTATTILDAESFEARLRAELDRCARYRRQVALAAWRCPDDATAEAGAATLRAMDVVGEFAGDTYLVLLPEVDTAGAASLLAGVPPQITVGEVVSAPADGQTADELLAAVRGRSRAKVRDRAPARAPTAEPAGLVVIDPAMRAVYALVDRVADASVTVLITGETGAGKEHVAQAIHARSRRAARPLVSLNCAALSEHLLESELFGHERGAFTGAERRRVGYFEATAGGSLFLDEIGEMPLPVQAKLLRVLERKTITRVGGTEEIAVDARVIVATHRDLLAEVRAGRFREDLFFRISGFTIVVPALRDRPADIVPLAERFARLASDAAGLPPLRLTEAACGVLRTHDWPGNVRELRNAIERAVILAHDGVIDLLDLPERVVPTPRGSPASRELPVRDQVAEIERAALVAALAEEHGNQTRAARRLGLSRRAMIYKMEKYGLKPPPHGHAPTAPR